jgi:Spy/CpxP family protein refolding chaperone
MKRAHTLTALSALTLGLLLGHQAPLAAQSAPAAAQPPASTPTPEQVVDKMSEKLSLSADQKAKITPIIADRQTKLKALAANGSLTQMQRARQARSIFQESDAKIEALLTPEQLPKYAQIKEEAREQLRQRAQQRGGTSG